MTDIVNFILTQTLAFQEREKEVKIQNLSYVNYPQTKDLWALDVE